MAGNEFQEASLCKSRDGTFWLATVTGANSFHPKDLTENPYIPPIHITNLKQGGEDIRQGKAPEKITEIKIDWQHNYFEFEFTALNYTNSQRNQYAFMLEGVDKDWFYAFT